MWEIGTAEFPAIADTLEALLPSAALWRYGADDDQDEPAESAESDSAPRLHVPVEALHEVCRRYDVKRIRLFGSALRDDFGPGSDIDMMVDFGPNQRTQGMGRVPSRR